MKKKKTAANKSPQTPASHSLENEPHRVAVVPAVKERLLCLRHHCRVGRVRSHDPVDGARPVPLQQQQPHVQVVGAVAAEPLLSEEVDEPLGWVCVLCVCCVLGRAKRVGVLPLLLIALTG